MLEVGLAKSVKSSPARTRSCSEPSTGGRQGATNVRRRILARAVELAKEQLAKEGADPMPEGLTPHSCRRTFASLLSAIGEPPPYVMAQMGHTTANLTLAIYARCMDRAMASRSGCGHS